jgi:hypothetical protein
MSFIKVAYYCMVNEMPGCCAYCGKRITRWDLFKGFFWKLPLRLNELSQLWELCCSNRCYGHLLARELGKMIARDIKHENNGIPD